MADKFIFHMYGVNKFYGQKQILKDINLSFFPGAKIGIVGENGSGKTTVLNIMSGKDTEFQGDAHIDGPGLHVVPLTLVAALRVPAGHDGQGRSRHEQLPPGGLRQLPADRFLPNQDELPGL